VIAKKPRPTGSPEIAEVRAHLKRTIEALGIEQSVQGIHRTRENGDCIETVNVAARIKGSGRRGLKTVLLMAHYDSVPNAVTERFNRPLIGDPDLFEAATGGVAITPSRFRSFGPSVLMAFRSALNAFRMTVSN